MVGMRGQSGIWAMVLLASASGATTSGLAQSTVPDVAPGWYAAADGRHLLVSPAPGRRFRRLDFEGADFGALPDPSRQGDARAGNGYRWAVGGEGGPVLVDPDGVRWTPWADAPYALNAVTFESADGVDLAGLLLLPRDPSGAGAIILHGSGDSDRDNVWAYTFAHALARTGTAVLFFDKRGSGGSGGDWRAVGLDALARDGAAGFDELVRYAHVRTACTGWVGLSQGGWVAPVAAEISGRGGYVVSVSSAAVPVFDQIAFEVDNTLSSEGVGKDGIESALGLQETIRRHATGNATWGEYRERRAAVLRNPVAAPFARAMPSDPDDWRWAWWARVGPFDPVEAWARAGVPVLVLYGAADEADNVPVARSVERLRRLARRPGMNGRIAWDVFPRLGHALVDERSGWVSSSVLTRIADFVASCPS